MEVNHDGIRVAVRVRPLLSAENDCYDEPEVFHLHHDSGTISYSPNLVRNIYMNYSDN